jgi:hypothetical protein
MVICVSVLNRTRNKEIELLHSWVNLSVCGPDEGRNGFEISQSPDRAEEIGTDKTEATSFLQQDILGLAFYRPGRARLELVDYGRDY